MPDLDPEGRRLPIKVDETSNGEFAPRPISGAEEFANATAHAQIAAAARKTGLSRRNFLTQSMGVAATLLAFNKAFGMVGCKGGFFDVNDEAAFDEELAQASVEGREFIFDVQTHCVDPSGDWAQGPDGERWKNVLNNVFPQRTGCGDGFDCYSAQQMVKEVFLDSDTQLAVVSALWGASGQNPTPTDYAAEARQITAELGGPERALIHGGVLPNEKGAIDFMEVQARQYKVDAWKLYPQWGPDGSGFFMDDPEYGIPFLEKARELGIKVVTAHRGLPLPFLDYKYSHPGDIARVAKQYPDMQFLCYHAGYEPGVPEGPYDSNKPAKKLTGVDRLVRAHQEAGFRPNEGNLYAELGSCWRHFMSKPDQAAHLLGKLIKTFGAERICWGTDSIWYGSPQDQIQTLRTFQITPEFRERFGYPELTREMKAQVFGFNAARVYGVDAEEIRTLQDKNDRVAQLRRNQPRNPSFQTYGPKTRKEFFQMWSERGWRPG